MGDIQVSRATENGIVRGTSAVIAWLILAAVAAAQAPPVPSRGGQSPAFQTPPAKPGLWSRITGRGAAAESERTLSAPPADRGAVRASWNQAETQPVAPDRGASKPKNRLSALLPGARPLRKPTRTLTEYMAAERP